MARPVEYRYADEIYENLGFLPAWLPVQTVELGAIGVLKGFRFEQYASLADFGIRSQQRTGSAADQFYATKSSVELRSKVKGAADPSFSAVPIGSAGLTVDFTSNWSIVFAGSGVRQTEIADLESITAGIGALDAWNPLWVLITAIVTVDTLTILIARSRRARIELAADIDVSAELAVLARADAGLRIASGSGLTYQLIGTGPHSPLYRAMYREDLHPSWRSSSSPEPTAHFAELTPSIAADLYDW